MKIAILSKSDSYGGGASRVAEELTSLLRDSGHTAHHYAGWWGDKSNKDIRSLYNGNYILIKGIHLSSKIIGFPELFPLEFFLLKKKLMEYDIVHFHDISSAISPFTVHLVSKLVPTVWTIHDCSPFTGGCLYPMGCEKYKTRCSSCPQLGQWPIDCYFDFTGTMQSIKRNTAVLNRVVYVTPSSWMADMAMSSGMFNSPPVIIPNGVDTSVFLPLNKQEIRDLLHLPNDKKAILISAGNILDERKGAKYSLEALRIVCPSDFFLIIVGSMSDGARKMLEGYSYYEIGYIGDKNLLAKYYAAADFFLFCSLADNMPLSVLETMATATPVIGFQTGGIPEMVLQNETGYLVPQKDTHSLANAIKMALSGDIAARWGAAARKRVEQNYSHANFVNNHVKLYKKILSTRGKNALQN